MPPSTPILSIASDALEVALAPEAGARVTAIIDRATGRNWLAEGEPTLLGAEEASYGLNEAAGWDECFPTVSPCDAPMAPWRRRLRDHGDLWGRPWRVSQRTATRIETVHSGDGLRFSRSLAVTGASVEVVYHAENSLETTTPFLWAMHPLFALRAGETIVVPNARSLAPTYSALHGEQLEAETLPWPEGDRRVPFPLDCVQGPEARYAGKFFFGERGLTSASLGGPTRLLDMTWQGVDHLGLWITYGAWPRFNDVLHVALEPTTSPDDTLEQAAARGRAAVLAPGGSRTWRVSLTLRAA